MTPATTPDKRQIRVLHVEDSEDDALLIRRELVRYGYDPAIKRVDTGEELLKEIAGPAFDIIISDYRLPGFSGFDALALVRKAGIDSPFIIVSGTIGEETAVAAMKSGAQDYIMKGALSRLGPAVEREVAEFLVRRERRRAEEELNDSRRFAAAIADASPNLLYMYDTVRRRITYVNDTVEWMLGYPKGEVIGQEWRSFARVIHPDDINELAAGLQALQALPDRTESKVIETEFRISRRSGGWRLLHNKLTVFSRDAEGRPLFVLGAAQDITERKFFEEQLIESRELLQHVVTSNPAVTFLLRVEAGRPRLSWISENIARFAGYTSTEAREPYWWADNVHPEDREDVRRTRDSVLGAEDQTNEYRFRLKDGSFIWLLENLQVIRDSSGASIEIVGTWSDITRRKQDEERIRELDTLVDLSGEAFMVRDLSNRVLFWNRGAEKLYGWTEGEAMGKSTTDLFGVTVESEQTMLDYLLRLGEWSGESVHQVKGGDQISVLSRLTLIRTKAGQPKSVLAVVSDITEFKRIQAQFLRAQRMENLGTLAGGIAHDLNNILSPIVMAINILSKKIKDPESERIFQALESSAVRGVEMVKQILTFARGVEGERIALQPRYLIEEIIKIASETFPRSIVFKKNLPKDLWTIIGDATQIHQVLLNLCVNARDAMPNGGILSISAANDILNAETARTVSDLKPGPYIKLTITDTGMGISKQVMAKIFDPFFTTKGSGKGTGLGLSTVSAIVKSHNGAITVSSEPDKGTSFVVWLPASTLLKPSADKPEDPLELLRGEGQRILIVDDEQSIREIAQMTLEVYGYRTVIATDGIEALAVYARESNDVDAVLMDMNMPFLDGNGAIRGLRKMNPEIKIIPCSGSMLIAGDEETPFEPGLDIRLIKPFTAEKLLKALHNLFHE